MGREKEFTTANHGAITTPAGMMKQLNMLRTRAPTNSLTKWDLALVGFRSSRCVQWAPINEKLSKASKRNVILKPFGFDRAIVFCPSAREEEEVIRKADLIGGDLIHKVSSWKLELYWEDS
ncbi:hypothetical protein Sjap_013776 [Stephania japonica]|uniref:Uncharacterized protein n=1 Tax=Stephania japonica TaxID=461633 RepID=A0AAP0IYI3_9MAGN